MLAGGGEAELGSMGPGRGCRGRALETPGLGSLSWGGKGARSGAPWVWTVWSRCSGRPDSLMATGRNLLSPLSDGGGFGG